MADQFRRVWKPALRVGVFEVKKTLCSLCFNLFSAFSAVNLFFHL